MHQGILNSLMAATPFLLRIVPPPTAPAKSFVQFAEELKASREEAGVVEALIDAVNTAARHLPEISLWFSSVGAAPAADKIVSHVGRYLSSGYFVIRTPKSV